MPDTNDAREFQAGEPASEWRSASRLNESIDALNTLKREYGENFNPDSFDDHGPFAHHGFVEIVDPPSGQTTPNGVYYVQNDCPSPTYTNTYNGTPQPDLALVKEQQTDLRHTFRATNLAEPDSRTLEVGTKVHWFAYVLPTSPPKTYYYFSVSNAGGALVKITGNAAGGGKYDGQICTAGPTADVDPDVNLAESDIGTFSTSCTVLNLAEVGNETHYIAAGTIRLAKRIYTDSDGTPVLVIEKDTSPVMVKITGNATGGGKYDGRILTGYSSDGPGTDLALPEGLTVPSTDDTLIFNRAETGQSTHVLAADSYWPGQVIGMSDEAMPRRIVLIDGGIDSTTDTCVTNMRFDTTGGTFQIKTRTRTFAGGLLVNEGIESDWTDIAAGYGDCAT